MICSARLAAAAGAGDHGGQKEEGKKDGITGRLYQNEKPQMSFMDYFMVFVLFDFKDKSYSSS